MYKILYVLLFLFCNINRALTQDFFTPKKYPLNKFQNPLKIPISLAGNFGECRPNHFHSGLDMRTNKVENIPVYAVADGFISRVKIEAGGFGNAIYITHSGGYTTLYAHLNLFYPELQQHIINKQYEQQSWRCDIQFMPHQFPIRQGQFIAYSGNTGSSQAPHLHLEVRDTKTEKTLNGMLFFNQLKDTKPPIIKQLAVYDANRSIYEQSPVLLPIQKVGTNYKLSKDTIKYSSNKIYFGIIADDFQEEALGTLGIYEMQLFVDGKPSFAWQMDKIGYDETRYMNALADYKMYKNKKIWIQLCHQLPNDKLGVYKTTNNLNGSVDLGDGKAHEIKIKVIDTRNNSSMIKFYARSNNNTVTVPTCEKCLLAGKKNEYTTENISFTLNENILYDDVCAITTTKASNNEYSYIYQVLNDGIPAHDNFTLHLKPKKEIPLTLQKNTALVRYYGNNEKKGKAASINNGMVTCDVKEFGTYEIVLDITPPSMRCNVNNGDSIQKIKRIICTVKEETTAVQSFRAEVNGKWLRFVQKGNVFYYDIDEHFPKGLNILKISAMDENGNTSTITINLAR